MNKDTAYRPTAKSYKTVPAREPSERPTNEKRSYSPEPIPKRKPGKRSSPKPKKEKKIRLPKIKKVPVSKYMYFEGDVATNLNCIYGISCTKALWFKVAGTSHYIHSQNVTSNTKLSIVKDYNNKFDSNAYLIRADLEFTEVDIGYVPKEATNYVFDNYTTLLHNVTHHGDYTQIHVVIMV